jgi:carboxyl-terminal processing protease
MTSRFRFRRLLHCTILAAALGSLGLGIAPLAAQQQGGQGARPTPLDVLRNQQGGQRGSEESEVFLSTLQVIRDFALEARADSLLWEMAIEGLLRELNDPYATVLSREEVAQFEEESTGNYAGIGVQITELNGSVTITAVFRGTPAERGGIVIGDRIVGVNEERALNWTVSDASSRIRGQPGTEVVVLIERDGISTPIPHRIRRDQVHIPAVTAERIFGDIQYLQLDRVARNAAAEVDSVLRAAQGARGLILDLRGNPGGYLDESLVLADLFLERGALLVSTKSRRPGDPSGPVDDPSFGRLPPRVEGLPVIVLVDRFSASASEIVAGALQDHDRALVMGERTFGKGTVQSVVPLPAGRLIRVTSGEWFTPLGRSLNRPRDREGRVIEPEATVEFTTPSGRIVLGGGGVVPDVDFPMDTLTLSEQRFVAAAVGAEIPLAQRIQEAAFEVAQRSRGAGAEAPDTFPSADLDRFVQSLSGAGVPADLLDAEVRGYLQWRLELALFQRLERMDRSFEVQTRRDPALQAAVELLKAVSTPGELFQKAGELRRD